MYIETHGLNFAKQVHCQSPNNQKHCCLLGKWIYSDPIQGPDEAFLDIAGTQLMGLVMWPNAYGHHSEEETSQLQLRDRSNVAIHSSKGQSKFTLMTKKNFKPPCVCLHLKSP